MSATQLRKTFCDFPTKCSQDLIQTMASTCLQMKSQWEENINFTLQNRAQLYEQAEKHRNAVNEIASKITASCQSKGLFSKPQNKIKALWPQYQSALSEYISTNTKAVNSTSSFEDLCSNYCMMLEQSENSICKDKITDLGKSISNAINNFSSCIDTAVQSIEISAAHLNFDHDFIPFLKTESNHVSFIETTPPPFQRYKFSNPYAQPDISIPIQLKLHYFPTFMVNVIKDFVGKTDDELSIKARRCIYMMEKPKDKWVLCMKLAYTKMGFVPVSCIEPIGLGCAVIISETEQALQLGKIGTILAVLSLNDQVEQIHCQNREGTQAHIPKQSLAILI